MARSGVCKSAIHCDSAHCSRASNGYVSLSASTISRRLARSLTSSKMPVVLFTVVENEKLVELVARFDCLYDLTSTPFYKNRTYAYIVMDVDPKNPP